MNCVNDISAPFARLLRDISAPQKIREIEAGGSILPAWDPIEQSGFLDVLVPVADGGAGLTLGEAWPLLTQIGRDAVPLPVAETMVARRVMADAGLPCPGGPIVLAVDRLAEAMPVPFAAIALHALIDLGDDLALIALSDDTRREAPEFHPLSATISCRPAPKVDVLPRRAPLMAITAVLRAAEIVGLGEATLAMTVDYANHRQQFGKPIARQQAVQQQIAVLAEKLAVAGIAAQLGFGDALWPPESCAAIAKQVASAAAYEIAMIAHAVHGAIGISAEHDLQIYTRRLHLARLDSGSETFWAGQTGRRRLASEARASLDFVREIM